MPKPKGKRTTADGFSRDWIIKNSLEIVERYDDGILTLRALYYQLVAIGMKNSIQHYKRVVSAMIEARREGLIRYEVFSDHDRETIGETKYEETTVAAEVVSSKRAIRHWLTNYYKNRWENQPQVVEVWIEKKALQGVFEGVCSTKGVSLSPCKGYPSLTFLNDAADRFREVIDAGKQPLILYFGDHDPSGEDIPRSLQANLAEDFGVDVELKVVALTRRQAIDMKLPPAPAKASDSRTVKFKANGGLGQIELDAIEPNLLMSMASDAIDKEFDFDIYKRLLETQRVEKLDYVSQLKTWVQDLTFDENGDLE